MKLVKFALWKCYLLFRDIAGGILSDKNYLRLIYRINFGKKLHLDNPKTFNEKLNWIKLYDRNPQYTIMADKYEAKDFVAKKLGSTDNIVPCLGVYSSFDEIDFSKLPEKFVIKATHDSSGVIICKDKSSFDISAARKRINTTMKKNYFPASREWPYKNIPRKVIVDKFLDNHSDRELTDYKFWCFNGVPKVLYITNKGAQVCENFYDMDFKPLDIDHGFPRVSPEFEKPGAFEEMKQMACKISKGIPFVRIDFFYVEGHVYFGECTFFDWGGMRPFKSEKWEKILGEWLVLPEKSYTS